MSAPPDGLRWARALREEERRLGLGTTLMTPHTRGLWRDVLAAELTPEEKATRPLRRERRRKREGLPC